MLEQRVLKAIGERLLSKSGCPANPSCPFDGLTKCLADEESLRLRRKRLEQDILEKHGGDVTVKVFLDDGTWPCHNSYAVFLPAAWGRALEDKRE